MKNKSTTGTARKLVIIVLPSHRLPRRKRNS